MLGIQRLHRHLRLAITLLCVGLAGGRVRLLAVGLRLTIGLLTVRLGLGVGRLAIGLRLCIGLLSIRLLLRVGLPIARLRIRRVLPVVRHLLREQPSRQKKQCQRQGDETSECVQVRLGFHFPLLGPRRLAQGETFCSTSPEAVLLARGQYHTLCRLPVPKPAPGRRAVTYSQPEVSALVLERIWALSRTRQCCAKCNPS